MAGRNGTSGVRALPVERELLRVTPDTITYPIERDDGETVALKGYRRGPGCPISVAIEIEEAWADWEDERPTEDDRTTLRAHRYLARLNRAERLLRRGLLQAAIPGLEDTDANILAADDGQWQAILVELGWWQAMPADDGAEADDGPESGAEASVPTGEPASADSSASMAPTTGAV